VYSRKDVRGFVWFLVFLTAIALLVLYVGLSKALENG